MFDLPFGRLTGATNRVNRSVFHLLRGTAACRSSLLVLALLGATGCALERGGNDLDETLSVATPGAIDPAQGDTGNAASPIAGGGAGSDGAFAPITARDGNVADPATGAPGTVIETTRTPTDGSPSTPGQGETPSQPPGVTGNETPGVQAPIDLPAPGAPPSPMPTAPITQPPAPEPTRPAPTPSTPPSVPTPPAPTPQAPTPQVPTPSTPPPVPSNPTPPAPAPSTHFQLSTGAFPNGGELPWAYACNGAIPPLQWSNAPAGTASFSVTLVDSVGGVVWTASNIPAHVTSLPAGGIAITMQRAGGCQPGNHQFQFILRAHGPSQISSSTTGPSVSRTVHGPNAQGPVLATSTLSASLTVR